MSAGTSLIAFLIKLHLIVFVLIYNLNIFIFDILLNFLISLVAHLTVQDGVSKQTNQTYKRIVNGRNAPQGSWTFMVSIRRRRRGLRSVHFCGGTLLDQRWVRFFNNNHS